MKKQLLTTVLLATLSSTGLTALADDTKLNSVDKKASYALGSDLAKNFQQQGVEIDIPALVLGMQDVMENKSLRLTDAEMQQAVNEVKKQVMQKQAEARKKLAEDNAQKGEAFLAKNKKRDDVKVTKSGLQYRIIEPGKGATPKEDDVLTANYKGTLIDGTEFDSSYSRGTPIEFQMGDVIPGWGEALKMMKPGAKWEIFVPPSLGYGSKGAGDIIGPNETLIFTIELIKAEKPAS
ncbi:FKBP-type peptidyl-prolyl cis-trans isomerase [Hydrogenovibrio thermophilus]|jgi:FKBP-type peptidyl-prolyl cis-trans isomerase FklB|uniref:Peptidyl-prolyl cis-trans isomerase n=1 Tax=Hydrogenovibrio thermophilus TaxID=265883 RepID=A0A410H205_9GAMM|nr:FKBP-type peptidyl-prolyl cis-trans isomerase [Hydrogenovibrio thermophilus]QAB14947.1 FKBP-type peptidyl-prolyl cis-trans isomerase [Hydrogenovibrio thermophilus]